ncbi:MAG TPA: hypothetical protein VMY42_09090 [Thermoguttaceae bacterium]|nr:hypothetical protein [Thermoguttaceae bacterium]
MGDAYKEGYEASKKGAVQDANPYAEEAEKSQQWNEGWEDARIEGELDRNQICRERT